MPPDNEAEESGPLEVKIVGGDDSKRSRQRRLWHDAALIVLSVVLSGAVAFGVARYTVDKESESQARDTNRQRLAAVYTPLSAAFGRVIACVAPEHCADAELLRADRAANAAIVAVLGQGSGAVVDKVSVLETTLRRIVEERNRGARPGTAIARRAARQFNSLENQISKELEN